MHPRLILALLVAAIAVAGAVAAIAVVSASLGMSFADFGKRWELWRLIGIIVAAAVGGYSAVLLAFSFLLTWFVRKVGNREFQDLAASMPRTGSGVGFLFLPFRRILMLYATRLD